MFDPEEANVGAFREVFKKILSSTFGGLAGETLMFLLKEALGCDPIETLWENPRAVYNEMVRIFGEGAKVLISILVSTIDREYGLDMSPERFLELIYNGSEGALKEIRAFMSSIMRGYGGQQRCDAYRN